MNKRITFLIGPQAQEPFFKFGDETLSPQEEYGFMKEVFGPNVVYDANKKMRAVQFQVSKFKNGSTLNVSIITLIRKVSVMKSMANGLKSSRMKSYVGKIEAETRSYLKGWGEKGEVDLLKALSELTILTATRCLHGNDVRENMFREVADLFHDLDKGLTPLTVFWPTAPIKAHSIRNKARIRMVCKKDSMGIKDFNLYYITISLILMDRLSFSVKLSKIDVQATTQALTEQIFFQYSWM